MSVLVKGAKSAIIIYQAARGPHLPSCRFIPSCSNYCFQSLEKHGLLRGLFFGLRRIVRCHPWGGWGFDPVPEVGTPLLRQRQNSQ